MALWLCLEVPDLPEADAEWSCLERELFAGMDNSPTLSYDSPQQLSFGQDKHARSTSVIWTEAAPESVE